MEDIITRYLNGSLFCISDISYVLGPSESITEIVLFLFVGSSICVSSLSWVQAMIAMQHFSIPNFLQICVVVLPKTELYVGCCW